jgi:hypothetical protein
MSIAIIIFFVPIGSIGGGFGFEYTTDDGFPGPLE